MSQYLYSDEEIDRLTRKLNRNPMVNLAGKLEGDKRCKTCKFLCVREFARRYYKCRFRPCTGGPATDHRVNWDACKKYEPND